MAFLAPAIPALIGAAGSVVGGLLGGKGKKTPQVNSPPPGINAGGLMTTFNGGKVGVTASPERLGLVSNLAGTFGGLADVLGGLRGQVVPGSSALLSSRLAGLENARSQGIGNLRQSLARRRVLGSSFGQDAILRAQSEFAQQEDRIRAESFLQALDAQMKLANAEYTARQGEFQTTLSELNLEAELASKLAGQAAQINQANAAANAKLQAEAQAGAGQFWGGIGGTVGKALGGLNWGSLFSGGGGFNFGGWGLNNY